MLEEKIQHDLTSAIKLKQENTVAALRSVKAAILNEKTNGKYHELTDDDIIKIIQKLVKQRKESMGIYSQAHRDELADQEQQEMLVLMNYLPRTLSDTDLESAIESIIDEVEATSIKDMGKVMKTLASRFPGQYDGKNASTIIKYKLNQ